MAAGRGERFGGHKQFTLIGDRPMVDWSVEVAKQSTDGVVLVLPPDDPHISAGDARGADVVVAGGDTRSASVRSGIAMVPADAEVIVVHDGARPFATVGLFKVVIEAVIAGADAAVPGLDVSDTLKRVSGDVVRETVSRDGLKTVQTPQAFRADLLRDAHGSASDATDDSALVEALGATVRVVAGEARNIKVTTRADLEIARALAGT